MFVIHRKEIEWGGRTLSIETGRIARQATASVVAQYGETIVLCAVTADKTPKEDIDFLPLTVNYQEKSFAAGRIPGGFFKREGRPSEKEILTSRLIDRPVRPLFNENFHNETQIVCTVLSHDLENDPDIVAIVGTAAALAISGLPFHGPLAGARVGYVENDYVLNPNYEQLKQSKLDLVVAGTEDSVLMVESEAQELLEEVMLGAVRFGHQHMKPVIDMINQFASDVGTPLWEITSTDDLELYKLIESHAVKKFKSAYKIRSKQERYAEIDIITKEILEKFLEAGQYKELVINKCIKLLKQNVLRRDVIENKIRIDGRAPNEIRPIDVQVNLLPRTHGSSLFTRGETQALVVTTLGTTQDERIIDALENSEAREHFMLHYNFPPYSVGEATPLRAPGRREIGHGKLAWRAMRAVMPHKESFPYTIRVVSEITESNGSSSMASVCGASLAMMDSGVPLKSAVSGIAMGLILESDGFVVLSDILGDEDHLGDMDFKVAGTKNGITALQMDIKVRGITYEIMDIALKQADEGRNHILNIMNKVMDKPRDALNKNAPTITNITIPKDKIRDIIGSGGKVIRDICEKSNAKIDIEDSGIVKIAATNQAATDKALAMINDIIAEPEIGHIYNGKVVKLMEFGAFVNFMGSRDGLVHISEIADSRVHAISDHLSEGQEVRVKLIGVERGKFKLSMKAVKDE